MAKVVFLQSLLYEFASTEILSACLKAHGHETDVLIDDLPDSANPIFAGATIIAFSVMTGFEDWALATARRLKNTTGTLTVFGGPHPTHCPEMVYEEGVDIVCRGEGEGAFVELADRLDRGEPITDVANLWIKQGEQVYRNEVRPLVADLDRLPLPDRSIYYRKYPFLAKNPHKPFLAGRGCPYSCSFCANEALRELYKGKGAYVRLRSPENLLAEIVQVRSDFGLFKVFFHDDTFVLNPSWLHRFLGLYEEHVRLPFYCQSRADTLSEDLAVRMKQAGCHCVFFAVESGVESMRCGILQKELTDTAISSCAELLRKNGIKISTYNLIGMPGETLEDALATVRMNIAIRADYPRCSFLTPYPGTKVARLSLSDRQQQERGKVDALSQQSRLHFQIAKKWQLENVHSLFQTAVIAPWAFPLIRKLVMLKLGPLFRAWWGVVYLGVFLRSEGRSIKDIGRYLPLLAKQWMKRFAC